MMAYLATGQEVDVIQKLDDGFLVETVIYDGEDNEMRGELRRVRQIFETAPREKFDKSILNLTKEIETLRKVKTDLLRQVSEIKKTEDSRITKYQQYEQLRLLDYYIDGKITHYVVDRWNSPQIVKFGDETCSYDHKQLKLLSLYGDSKGNLEWKLHYYSDGSGGSETVYPATSYEDALEIVKKLILDDLSTDKVTSSYVIEAAKKYGVPVPPEYMARFKEDQRVIHQKLIEECQNKIDKAVNDLRKIENL